MTFSSFNGGFSCWASRVSPRRATHFSLLRQRKVSKRKATQVRVSLRCATGNLRCSQQAGRMQTRYAQTCILLDPPVAALLGTRTWVERERDTRAGEFGGRGFSFLEIVGANGSSGCLSPYAIAAVPSSAGNRAAARMQARHLFAYLLLAKQEKVSRPPGRDPASHASNNTTQNTRQPTPTPAFARKAHLPC
jgi:hypothetical protein